MNNESINNKDWEKDLMEALQLVDEIVHEEKAIIKNNENVTAKTREKIMQARQKLHNFLHY